MKLCSSQYIHLYLRLFLWFVGILFLLCSSYTVRRNFSNWSTLLWKRRALVSQLDGGFHEQYFAYEWTIVQAIFWHCQTFSSIFWVFFTSQLSSVPKEIVILIFIGREGRAGLIFDPISFIFGDLLNLNRVKETVIWNSQEVDWWSKKATTKKLAIGHEWHESRILAEDAIHFMYLVFGLFPRSLARRCRH